MRSHPALVKLGLHSPDALHQRRWVKSEGKTSFIEADVLPRLHWIRQTWRITTSRLRADRRARHLGPPQLVNFERTPRGCWQGLSILVPSRCPVRLWTADIGGCYPA